MDVNLARHGLVDESLLLLLQQRNQLLLAADVAPHAPIGVVEEADDAGLFRDRGTKKGISRIRAIDKSHCPMRTPSEARVKHGT